MRRHFSFLPLAALALAFFGAATLSAQPTCTGINRITWPTVNPIWDFCWTRPASTMQPDGEGIRITEVFYKGRKVWKDGGIPVLNVKYAPGGCGGGGLCYRDWFDQEKAFTCAPVPSTGYCTATTTAVSTVCNHPNTDAGTFSGVAVVDKGTSIKLTSQAQAGWYRYIATWEFFADGRIHPGMDITAVQNSCVAFTHRHHAYWRFDFDLDGNTNNFAESVGQSVSTRIATERTWTDKTNERSQWRFGRVGSSTRAYVARDSKDGFADGDTFGKIDGAVLAYKSNELHDSSSGCDINIAPFVTTESVNNTDLVLWVHSEVDHVGEPGGVAADCSMFGPTIKIRTAAIPADFNGDATSDVKLYQNGTWVSYPVP